MAQHLNFPNVLQNYQNLYDNHEKCIVCFPIVSHLVTKANKQEVNDPPKKVSTLSVSIPLHRCLVFHAIIAIKHKATST